MKPYLVYPNADSGGDRAANARFPLYTQKYLSGGSPVRFFQAIQQRGLKHYLQLAFWQWPGPWRQLPRQWQNLNGALAGTRSRGFLQENVYATVSPPNPRTQNWYVQHRSTRNTSQKFNGSNTGLYIPAIFVPTAAVNQRGVYSA